jgi:glycosyltransferase involved in cell wall biosynthesis
MNHNQKERHPVATTVYYITPRDMLKSRVDPIMMMQTCASIRKLGHDVTMVTPDVMRTENISRDDVWAHYKLEGSRFKLVILPTFLRDESSLLRVSMAKLLAHSVYALKLLFRAIFSPSGRIVIISRCIISTLPYLVFLAPIRRLKRIKITFELHAYTNTLRYRFVLRRMDMVFCITERLRNLMCNQLGVNPDKTAVSRLGVNLDYYKTNTPDERKAVLSRFGVDPGNFIAMYTGKIYPGQKEIALILQAASINKKATFMLVGGKPEAVDHWLDYCRKNEIHNVKFTGFVSPDDVIRLQSAANALLIYYPGDWPIRDFVSPGKMMEYMATGNVIIAVRFPVLQEVLQDGVNSLLVDADRPEALSDTVKSLQADPHLAGKLGKQASADVVQYSWDNRAKHMMEILSRL